MNVDVFFLQADRKRQADMKKAQLAKEAQLEEGEYEAAVRSEVPTVRVYRQKQTSLHSTSILFSVEQVPGGYARLFAKVSFSTASVSPQCLAQKYFRFSTHLVRYNATLSERERRETEAKHAACMEHRSAILLQVCEKQGQ